MIEKIGIGIAEDQGLVRNGFVRILEDYPNIKILFEATNGKELLKGVSDHKPHVILLDIAMPILGGIKVMEKLKTNNSKVKIIVLSAYCEDEMIIEYAKLGAKAFLDKNCKEEDLVKAIQSAYDGGIYFSERIAKLLIKHGVHPTGPIKRELTDKELAILKLISRKKEYTEIAKLVGLGIGTIHWYESHMMRKTNSKDVDDLIAYAQKNQLI